MLLLLPPIRKLSSVNGTTAAMTAAAESLFRVIDELPEKDAGTKTLENYSGAVEFRDVSFAYPNEDKQTISHFSLSVKPGEMIALVGSSGAGKSTLINLIPRFWVPTEGEIYFDGIAQSELTLKSLRKQIGLVSQDVTIFDDTIANNIAYGCRDKVTREQIEAAAEAAALTDFIKTPCRKGWTLRQDPTATICLVGSGSVFLSRERFLRTHPSYFWMRQRVLWTRKVKSTFRSHWIRSLRDVHHLLLHIACQPSSMLTALL